jgi:hypothetical protein
MKLKAISRVKDRGHTYKFYLNILRRFKYGEGVTFWVYFERNAEPQHTVI